MASWLIPALKAVLPHVGSIVAAAGPVFTKKKADAPGQPAPAQDQIAELQAAASLNAANIKDLAKQLETTVAAIEQAAENSEARIRRALLMSFGALMFSAIALCIALFVAFSR